LCVYGMQKCNMTQLDKDDSLMQMQLQTGISDLTSLGKHKIKQNKGEKCSAHIACFPFHVANERQSSRYIIITRSATQVILLCEEVVMPTTAMQHGLLLTHWRKDIATAALKFAHAVHAELHADPP